MRDLLPNSGSAATPAHTSYYSGMLFALFLVGWGIYSKATDRARRNTSPMPPDQQPEDLVGPKLVSLGKEA